MADFAFQPSAQFAITFDREKPAYLGDCVGLLRQLAFEFRGKIERYPSIPASSLGGKQLLD